MPARVAPKKHLPIGVELGPNAARLVQLRGTAGGVELSAFGVIDIPPVFRSDQAKRLAFLASRLPSLLKSERFKGRKCIIALPAESSFVRHVKIRPADGRGLEVAVRRAARDELPYPVSEAVLRHIDAGDVYRNGELWKEIIIVAVPTRTMDAYLHMASRAGLEVVGVHVEPMAIVDCFTSLFESADTAGRGVLYLDLDDDNIQVIISRGRHVLFTRYLSCRRKRSAGPKDASRPETETSPQEARPETEPDETASAWLAEACGEIEKSLRYYTYTFRAGPVSRIVFTGARAKDVDLCRRLAERLSLPAQMGDPLRGLLGAEAGGGLSSPSRPSQPDLAVAVGLSLAGREM